MPSIVATTSASARTMFVCTHFARNNINFLNSFFKENARNKNVVNPAMEVRINIVSQGQPQEIIVPFYF